MKNVGFKNRPIQALIITNHDEHMSEYLAEKDRRLKYVSGFSGSAGTAIITDSEANLWTDGRYFIQAVNEMDSNWNLMKSGIDGTLTESEWLSKALVQGSFVATDPKLISYTVWNNLKDYLEIFGITLVPLSYNFVDEIWKNKPVSPVKPVKIHDIKYAGLLNLRGEDIKFNPVFFSFLVISFNEIHLFIDEEKITNSIENYFMCDHLPIKIHSYDSIYFLLSEMEKKINKVWLCKGTNYQIYDIFPKCKQFCQVSPISKLKAVKNETEIVGMKNAHIKDGIALCRYFSWLENEIVLRPLTEISAAKMLECFRNDEEDYVGLSFDTISSVGSNAAIIHYSPNEDTNKTITKDEIYLCDSGGQYLDGTTDVTRTLHFGKPTDFQKECFTRVLKGSIALATAKFPNGIKGNFLDSLARQSLWSVGLNYKHGTGHGIGSYLCVHEGPIGIANRPLPDDPGLQVNMFLSDEPGYYHDDEFGIRIENIVQIVEAETKYKPQDAQGFLKFETITMCPIQIKMLDLSLLTEEEICFINAYHQTVRDTLSPILQKRQFITAHDWLLKETVAIMR
ncbi:hypothetical protein O3M35_011725 [Rhynocoris fuscipes]|uniref:Xaa-Pro aminopeptidase 1 n=1 Tax=Rhynocoris fuscipes TaxID=488301 RepID=A0AAW1D3G2_9HEMI